MLELEGGEEHWLEIGQVLYEPLMLEKSTGKVYLFFKDTREGILLGDFYTFMLHRVLGSGYRDMIIPDVGEDRWFLLLKQEGFA